MTGFRVVSTGAMTMHRTNRLVEMYTLSPFVWHEDGLYHVLVRAVPRRDDEPRLKMSELWYGTSADGVHFGMDAAPAIFPGPGLFDLDGCEDPTVLREGSALRVWYTGYNEREKVGRLLAARGPDARRLAKSQLAIDSAPGFANPKEASVAPMGGDAWRMYFEYSDGSASLIGQATTGDLDGAWTDITASPIAPRLDHWDQWHLSPGPIVDAGGPNPTLFYNGADRNAAWRIGWATFDRGFSEVVDRCREPLISPDQARQGGSDIVFAASAVEVGDSIRLYYSQSDQDLRYAIVERV